MKTLPFGVRDEPMRKHTSLHIGGPADYFVRVTTERDLVGAIAVAREHELPVLMLGGGTNMLVSDRGVRGVVLQNDWSETTVEGLTITASSGTPLASVAAVAARSGIAGLEWMATVPGTVGGAVHGNAGAFGSETKDVLVDATLLDLNGERGRCRTRSGIRVSHLSLQKTRSSSSAQASAARRGTARAP